MGFRSIARQVSEIFNKSRLSLKEKLFVTCALSLSAQKCLNIPELDKFVKENVLEFGIRSWLSFGKKNYPIYSFNYIVLREFTLNKMHNKFKKSALFDLFEDQSIEEFEKLLILKTILEIGSISRSESRKIAILLNNIDLDKFFVVEKSQDYRMMFLYLSDFIKSLSKCSQLNPEKDKFVLKIAEFLISNYKALYFQRSLKIFKILGFEIAKFNKLNFARFLIMVKENESAFSISYDYNLRELFKIIFKNLVIGSIKAKLAHKCLLNLAGSSDFTVRRNAAMILVFFGNIK